MRTPWHSAATPSSSPPLKRKNSVPSYYSWILDSTHPTSAGIRPGCQQLDPRSPQISRRWGRRRAGDYGACAAEATTTMGRLRLLRRRGPRPSRPRTDRIWPRRAAGPCPSPQPASRTLQSPRWCHRLVLRRARSLLDLSRCGTWCSMECHLHRIRFVPVMIVNQS